MIIMTKRLEIVWQDENDEIEFDETFVIPDSLGNAKEMQKELISFIKTYLFIHS